LQCNEKQGGRAAVDGFDVLRGLMFPPSGTGFKAGCYYSVTAIFIDGYVPLPWCRSQRRE
jgi:hypothetical protein